MSGNLSHQFIALWQKSSRPLYFFKGFCNPVEIKSFSLETCIVSSSLSSFLSLIRDQLNQTRLRLAPAFCVIGKDKIRVVKETKILVFKDNRSLYYFSTYDHYFHRVESQCEFGYLVWLAVGLLVGLFVCFILTGKPWSISLNIHLCCFPICLLIIGNKLHVMTVP